jgi:ADP-ribose pyrophosphatase YjhB (NUDIX family)
MKHRVGAFDVWVYGRHEGVPHYLLLRTSQEKADRWFNGGRFWQVPTEFTNDGESLATACTRCLHSYAINAQELWAVEHTYTIYNRRYEELHTIIVLAASVSGLPSVQLTWEHSEYRWCKANECESLLGFRGLQEGLIFARKYASEVLVPLPELRLA